MTLVLHPCRTSRLACHIAAVVTLNVLLLASPALSQTLEGVDPKHPHDGDGFHIAVRLLGVDTPEKGSRAKCPEEARLADLAHERAKDLLRDVRVTLDVRGVDKFGRLLATVTLPSGETLGDVLKREGLARDWPLERAWCETP